MLLQLLDFIARIATIEFKQPAANKSNQKMRERPIQVYACFTGIALLLAVWLCLNGQEFMMLRRGMKPLGVSPVWITILLAITIPPALLLRNLGALLSVVAFAIAVPATVVVFIQEPGTVSIQQLLIGLATCVLVTIAISRMNVDFSEFELSDLLR